MDYTLSNGELTVKFKSFGGELTSVCDKNGVEYLWQADKTYWGGQAPVLFPIVGSLRNKKAIIGGDKVCCMERHGVARKKEFMIEKQTDSSITFVLCSDEETKQRYPYDFKLLIEYILNGRTVTTKYTVENPNREVLPFQIGGHPAFNCPILSGEKFEDYIVEFEYPETVSCPMLDAAGLVDTSHRVSMLNNEKSIRMRHDLFKEDALILDTLKSRMAKLYHPKTGRGIQMDFADMDYLLIWSSANGGPFVALEPWSGISTCNDESDIFEEKRGVHLLEPGKSESLSFDITVLN